MTVQGFWYAYLPLLIVLAVVALVAILLGFLIGRSRGRRAAARAEARVRELEAAQSRAAAQPVPVPAGPGGGAAADGWRPEQPASLAEGLGPQGMSEPGATVADGTAAAVAGSLPGGETAGVLASAVPSSEQPRQQIAGESMQVPVFAAPDGELPDQVAGGREATPAQDEPRGPDSGPVAEPFPSPGLDETAQVPGAPYGSEQQVFGDGEAVPEPEAAGGHATGWSEQDPAERAGEPAAESTPQDQPPFALDPEPATSVDQPALHEWTADQVRAFVASGQPVVAGRPGWPTEQDWADTAPTRPWTSDALPEPSDEAAGSETPVSQAIEGVEPASAESMESRAPSDAAGPATASPRAGGAEPGQSRVVKVPATAPWPGQAHQGVASDEQEHLVSDPGLTAATAPGVLPLPGPRPRPGRGWVADSDQVRPASPGSELVQMRQALNRAEAEMARLEAAAVQAWDRTVPALEARIEELTTENATLLRQLLATEAQLELVHERSQRQLDARRTELEEPANHG
ncbi:MAG: hypothetical protein Q4G45_06375 [Actinomycetia bacterium]|nr:hypothetical protein [Actinomycetes bacterium]